MIVVQLNVNSKGPHRLRNTYLGKEKKGGFKKDKLSQNCYSTSTDEEKI